MTAPSALPQVRPRARSSAVFPTVPRLHAAARSVLLTCRPVPAGSASFPPLLGEAAAGRRHSPRRLRAPARSPEPTRPRQLTGHRHARPSVGACHPCLCCGSRSPRLTRATQRGGGGAGERGGRFLPAKRGFWASRGTLPFSPGSGSSSGSRSRSRFLPSRCFLPRPWPLFLGSDILRGLWGGGRDARCRRQGWPPLSAAQLRPPPPAAPVPECAPVL